MITPARVRYVEMANAVFAARFADDGDNFSGQVNELSAAGGTNVQRAPRRTGL